MMEGVNPSDLSSVPPCSSHTNMTEGGIPNNPSSGLPQRIRSIRRLISFDVAHRRLQLLPERLSRLHSLPSSRSSIQSSPEFESIAQSLLDISLSSRSSSPIFPTYISPETTVFYSCDAGEDNIEALRGGSSNHKVLEWMFSIANFIIELSSIVFDQLSSQHNSLFLPICMGMSFLALVICLFELVYKVRKERLIWMWKDTLPWFYYPSQTGVPFSSYIQIVGLICAFGQCIVSTTSYCLFINSGKNPIKISIWATIFAFCQLCSKLFQELRQDIHRKGVSSIELTSSSQ